MRRLTHVVVAVFSFLVMTIHINTVLSAVTPMIVPSGFVDEEIYGGLLSPRAFTFLPDGRVLAVERGSATSSDSNLASIRVFKNGMLLPTRAYTLNTCGDSERGFLGIAVDPNFATNGHIYVYYTRQATGGAACGYNTFTNGVATGPRNRVSRLTMSGDSVIAGSERVLIDSIITDIGYHNAGDLHFGLDGYLYISVGEGGLPWTSPNTGVLNGKILRILPTPGDAGGYTTLGNPYDTASGARFCATISPSAPDTLPGPCREIYAKGLRNPFRFTIQPTMIGIPGAGSPIVGDVGGGAWEEINSIRSGGDYGYPVREGFCSAGVVCSTPYQATSYDNPVYAYSHVVVNANFDSAVIGGDFYMGGAGYPSQYNNDYFFAEFARGFIGRLKYNAGNGQWERIAQDFATGGNGIVGLKRGLDGNLYYLTFTSETGRVDGIRRIRYTNAQNQLPIGQASVSPQSGDLNTIYTFSAAGSYDPDGNTPLTYNWDFGDGTSISTSSPTVTHVYTQVSNRTAVLTVTDSGTPPAISTPVTVNLYPGNAPPSAVIVLTNLSNSSRTTTFYAGDTWSYAVANAADDEPLPPDAFSWEIVFHHNDHTHPFLPFLPGESGQFEIPITGELAPTIWYRVHLFITDVRGQRTEVIQDIFPETTTLTLDTNPPGGQVIVEGAIFPAPHEQTFVVGMHFSVDVPSPQLIGSSSYTFSSWSEGSTQLHTITAPPVDTTYTANLEVLPFTLTPIPTPTAIVGQSQTITVQVSSAWDDANELNGTVTNTSPMAWVGNGGSSSTSYLGLRFTNVTIPQGATINSAELQFYSPQSQWIGVATEIGGELSGASQPFNVAIPSLRPLTTARVIHNTNAQWFANTWYSFAAVKDVTQEVINQPIWTNGGNLAFIIRGTGGTWGRKFFTSFDGSSANAPRLLITYTNNVVVASSTPTPTPTDTFTPTSTYTPTDTSTPTLTYTPTDTLTPTSTYTPTDTPTNTPTPTDTSTPTLTYTPTDTSTPTSTYTPTDTSTPTSTYTPTDTPTNPPTPTDTSTPTSTYTPTDTPTNPPTPSYTPTPIPTATFTPIPVSGVFTRQVRSGSDDVNQEGTVFQATTSSSWIGNAGSLTGSYTAFRFTDVQVPRGATVTAARLEFYSNTSNQWLTINLQIAGDAADNSASFTANALPSQRILTTARVAHTSNTNWLANTWYQFTDMRTVVQEIITRPNWQPGNSLSIILLGTGNAWGRKFVSTFERGAAFAPRLVITYTS